MKKVGVDPRLWVPRQVTRTELDDWPRCVRCTRREGYSVAIEAYGISDVGSHRVEIMGKCRGVCARPWLEARLPKAQWVDALKVEWDSYSDANVDDPHFQEALNRQIASLQFHDDAEVVD